VILDFCRPVKSAMTSKNPLSDVESRPEPKKNNIIFWALEIIRELA
jgi:hypothetical protein